VWRSPTEGGRRGAPDPRELVDEVLTTIPSFDGAEKDGSGIAVRPGGKIVKIPPRQDLHVIPAEQRDELIVQAVQVLAQDISDPQLKAGHERATAGG
jgi:hypothetical protein